MHNHNQTGRLPVDYRKSFILHRRSRRERGAVLVLALVYLALTLGLLSLLSAGGVQLFKTGRHERENIEIRQMMASGVAWAQENAAQLAEGEAITLEAKELLPQSTTGSITVSLEGRNGGAEQVVVVSIEFSHGERVVQRSARFELSGG